MRNKFIITIKKYLFILLTVSYINTQQLISQTTTNICNCCTENQNQFYFWIGELNSYYKTCQIWNQVWIDNSDYVIKLKGQLINGSMVLKSELKNTENRTNYDQISWTKNEGNS